MDVLILLIHEMQVTEGQTGHNVQNMVATCDCAKWKRRVMCQMYTEERRHACFFYKEATKPNLFLPNLI